MTLLHFLQQILSHGCGRFLSCYVVLLGLDRVEEIRRSGSKHQHRDYDREQKVRVRGPIVDDRAEREHAEHESEYSARYTKWTPVRPIAIRFVLAQAYECSELEGIRSQRTQKRQIDEHGAQPSIADDVMQRCGDHHADAGARDQRHVGSAASRVQVREHIGEVAIARDSEQQLAHAEDERVEAADEPNGEQPCEARGRAVVPKDRLVAIQQRRRGHSHLRGPGADHGVENDRAERDRHERRDGREQPQRHVLAGLDSLFHGQWQLLNAQVEPEREREPLDDALESVGELPVLLSDPLVV